MWIREGQEGARNSLKMTTDRLQVQIPDCGDTCLDTRTLATLLEASLFVRTMERTQIFKIACLRKIGFNNGWLPLNEFHAIIKNMNSPASANYQNAFPPLSDEA